MDEKLRGTVSQALDIGALYNRVWEQQREARANRVPSKWEVEAKDTRGTVTVSLYNGTGYEMPDKLADAIAWLAGHLESVPEDCRDTATIDVGTEDSYGDMFSRVEIEYRRPETDEEWAKRRAEVERQIALYLAQREEHDRAEFERLRAKFT